MLFSGEVLLFAAGTIVLAGAEKVADAFGFEKVGMVIRLLIPIVAYGSAIYFLEFNPFLKWVGL